MTVTTFYTTVPQPAISHKQNRGQAIQKILSGGVVLLFAVMILENLFSALIRSIYGELVGLAQSDVTVIVLAVIVAVGDSVQMFPESIARSILDAVVIL